MTQSVKCYTLYHFVWCNLITYSFIQKFAVSSIFNFYFILMFTKVHQFFYNQKYHKNCNNMQYYYKFK